MGLDHNPDSTNVMYNQMPAYPNQTSNRNSAREAPMLTTGCTSSRSSSRRRNWWRLYGAVIPSLAVVMATSSDPAAAACVPFLTFNDRQYVDPPYELPGYARTPTLIAKMTVPRCVDVVDPTNPPTPASDEVTITRVRGVDPRIAIGVSENNGSVRIKVRVGVCVQRAGHPKWSTKKRLRCLQTYLKS